MHARSKNWLIQNTIPLWSQNGIDWKGGGFFEELSLEGIPLEAPKRALVQARQIYSFRVAKDLNCLAASAAEKIVGHGIDFLLKDYSLPSGAFIHSVDQQGKPKKSTPELYTQSFALFGMANAYAVNPDTKILKRAKDLLSYLHRERRVPAGGFSEFHNDVVVYQSNPHMHLFEAALSWMDVDQDPAWRALADELLKLCKDKFIDSKTGLLAEHFDKNWTPIREGGRFVFEPGHQYEWAWLMGRYEKHTGVDLGSVRKKFFETGEKECICPTRKVAYDEMWSDLKPKTKSSRFWPQCERIKAAAQFRSQAKAGSERESFERIVNEALSALFLFFNTPKPGLWFDRCSESLEFSHQPAKASSLYHIIGAIEAASEKN